MVLDLSPLYCIVDVIMNEVVRTGHLLHNLADFFLEVLLLCAHIGMCQVEAVYRWFVRRPVKDVRGRTVLVTGSASGIGRQLAIKLGTLGCKLVLWDINEDGNKRTAQLIIAKGGQAFPYTCDVRKRADVLENAVRMRQDVGSDVDILVNNAGVLICKDLLQLSEEDIKTTLETNTMAHFWTVKEFLPTMIKNKYGHIVTLSSMSGLLGVAMVTDYSASKFAVMGFTEALEEEIERMGLSDYIHTTIACPYMVNTNLLASISHRAQQRSRFDKPMEADEVAEQIVDGMLHNDDRVHIPGKTSSIHLIKALMPKKALRYITQFSDSGFFPVKNKTSDI